jgi:hypothetical protein
MSKKLIAAAFAVAGLAIGLAPTAEADGINTEVCRAVMALGVNPYNPSDSYTVNMLQRYPDMTYNQAKALVERAYRSVQLHENSMCDGVTIPDNY